MTFFKPNQEQAETYAKDKYPELFPPHRKSKVVLAEKQIPHVAGWNTYEIWRC